MSPLEQELHTSLMQIHDELVCNAGKLRFSDQAPLCADMLRSIHELYPDLKQALDGLQSAPEAIRPALRSALAYVVGCSHYDTFNFARRYHAQITLLGREEPDFLKDVLAYAQGAAGNYRLTGTSSQRLELIEGEAPDVMLGSLLAQPAGSVQSLEFDLTVLRQHLQVVKEYVAIAKVCDPYGLTTVRDNCRNALERLPLDLGVADGSGMALRRVLFDDELTTPLECEARVRVVAVALFGGRSSPTPQKLAEHLEAVGSSPEFMEHCFINDLYRHLQEQSAEYALRDPCEESFKPGSIATQTEQVKVLKQFLIAQGLDYRIKLAPWILSCDNFGQCLEIRSRHGHDERWLDRAAIRAAGEWMKHARDHDATSRAQARRYGWINTLTERDCISLCQDEHQLMACFKATGNSSFIHRLQAEHYREAILSSDLGI